MTTIPEIRGLQTSDLYVLAYAHHMARTSRSEAARQMFEAYMEHEKKWHDTHDLGNVLHGVRDNVRSTRKVTTVSHGKLQ